MAKRRGQRKTRKKAAVSKAASKRAAKKAAKTREVKAGGGSFVKERVTSEAGFQQRIYDADSVNREVIQSAIEREQLETRKDMVLFAVIEGVDDDGKRIVVGTRAIDARGEGAADDLADSLDGLTSQYGIANITNITFTFSVAR